MSGSVTLAPFTVQLITLTHSIPEPNAVVIRTQAGAVLHTGDWKLDPDPVIGEQADERALRALAEENVLAMICDSTNVMVEGSSGSEAEVAKSLRTLIAQQRGQVAVTCFATNVARLHSLGKAAHENGRRACLLGRSLRRIYDSAQENGYLKDIPPFLAPDDIALLEPEQRLFICTGSQGEPLSAMAKVAANTHPVVSLGAGDTVIYSSRMIPGNEKAIGRVQNQLAVNQVRVITDSTALVHVSGHPAQDELRRMYDWVRPMAVIPVHGERRHLQEQAAFALSCQVPHALVIENGAVVRLNDSGAPRVIARVETGRLAVNGHALMDLQSEPLRQLKKVIINGSVTVSLCIDLNGDLLAPVQISTLGLLENDALAAMLPDVEEAILEEFSAVPDAQIANDARLGDLVRRCARRILKKSTGKMPRIDVHLHRVDI
jgi:ribonuclease J